MAKLSIIAREEDKQKLVKSRSERRKTLNEASKDISLSLADRMEAQRQLQRMPRNSSPIRVTRRCRLCGRPRGVYRKFGLCRIHLRELLLDGEVTGGRKSSW